MVHRIERLNSLLRQEISEIIIRQVKDPRLDSSVIVTAVETAADIKHATIFVSKIGTEAEKQETLAALETASGFFRHELGEKLRLRHIPELSFQWDDSIERGDHLLQLIDKVTEESHQE
ncbi:MAG: 30S ribosome-binding factor RbfA [Chloroflexota bacterium]